jgi:hypothetical protein
MLQTVDFSTKAEIIESLSELLPSVNPQYYDIIRRSIYAILQSPVLRPDYEREEDQSFVRVSLVLLCNLGDHSKQFYIELMMAYMDGNQKTRETVLNILNQSGVKDINGLFAKELELWDIYCVNDDRNEKLRTRCAEFLDKWLICFRNHVRDMVSKLHRGQPIEGRVMASHSVKGLHKETSRSTGAVTVTLESADMSAADNATYIEAINYYCEMTLNKQLLQGQLNSSLLQAAEGGTRNTVVALPRLTEKSSLIRLGETHVSKRHDPRAVGITDDMLYQPITSVNYPTKHIVVNPFPSPLDQYDPLYTGQVLLMLQKVQKYFIPARSYVTN